ncbi:MAG TPA: dTDP-4-dehydrorhamnose reductase [Bacteroidales bacterium]|nr:dTDP-4-dehydrorhamnose reductase [Bacteroidales bacterium]
MMKKILVTGSDGQLGMSLKNASGKYSGFSFHWIDVRDVDLTDTVAFDRFFIEGNYDYIINCAAFTAVDKAEAEQHMAYKVNEEVPARLATYCIKTGCRLIHISTDYIYDGDRCLPHQEEEEPKPASVYAKSKLAGEKHLWNSSYALIIRTSWLYSEFGNNFMKTMVRLSEKNEVRVVYDQVGTPTYAGDLALVILDLIEHSERIGFEAGIYNYTNEGVCSWFDFATEIMRQVNSRCAVKPIRSSEFPSPVKRPAFSVLDKSKIKRKFGIEIPYWKDSMILAVRNLKNIS